MRNVLALVLTFALAVCAQAAPHPALLAKIPRRAKAKPAEKSSQAAAAQAPAPHADDPYNLFHMMAQTELAKPAAPKRVPLPPARPAASGAAFSPRLR